MFSLETFKKSIGIIAGTIGIALYVIGYGFMEQNTNATQIVLNIADVLVIGVVVGYLSSVAQWAGVFKREIQDIIYGKDFIGERKDIETIWNNVTKQLLKNKFAEIHKELLYAIRTATIPSDEIVSYYEDYDSDIQLIWKDREKGIVQSIESISFTLVADSDKEIKLPIRTWTTSPKENECIVGNPEITIDGAKQDIVNDNPERQGSELMHSSIVILKGKKQYQISYVREKVYDITKDYHIGLRSQFLVRNITVSLHLPDGIEAVFIERGTSSGFSTVKNTKDCIKKKLKGVIFPKQGYIFALRVQ